MAARLTNEDIETAIAWLEVNEGTDTTDDPTQTEMASCQRVIAFLRTEIATRQREATIRTVAKECGRPASDVRKLMKTKGL